MKQVLFFTLAILIIFTSCDALGLKTSKNSIEVEFHNDSDVSTKIGIATGDTVESIEDSVTVSAGGSETIVYSPGTYYAVFYDNANSGWYRNNTSTKCTAGNNYECTVSGTNPTYFVSYLE
ncbi:MAG: hypothetical protein MJB14_08755 [Spirochaetes bacterium]|nr:hypothetical protein [Spirochaetota bacterium]